MNKTGDDVYELIAKAPTARRREDAETMLEIMRDVTGREPERWGTIIGFGSCHYRYPTGNEGDSPILAFAARRQATTVYLLDGVDAHRETLSEIGPHDTGVGCLYLKDLRPLDHAVLRRLLTASYDHVISGGSEYATLTIND